MPDAGYLRWGVDREGCAMAYYSTDLGTVNYSDGGMLGVLSCYRNPRPGDHLPGCT